MTAQPGTRVALGGNGTQPQPTDDETCVSLKDPRTGAIVHLFPGLVTAEHYRTFRKVCGMRFSECMDVELLQLGDLEALTGVLWMALFQTAGNKLPGVTYAQLAPLITLETARDLMVTEDELGEEGVTPTSAPD